MKIEQTENQYIVSDTTDGGYVTRTSRYTCNWRTVWSLDLKLIEFYLDGTESTRLLSNKEDFDYHRARRAKGRHLRALKEMQGLVEEKKPKELEKVLLYEQGVISNIQIKDVRIHEKTLDLGLYSVKKHTVKYVLATEENIALAEEYNQKLKDFHDYKDAVFSKLFNEK